MSEYQEGKSFGTTMSNSLDRVLVAVAWPYANGPLHLGHVAGCYLPPDIHARFEIARGNKVLIVSGSDEHGTPITVSAEQSNVTPQSIVDNYHAVNSKALDGLGCIWSKNLDSRGADYGGALFNRTTDPEHKKIVQDNFKSLHDAGFFETKSMEQYFEINPEGGGRFLPDRYVEGDCPECNSPGARGDQCDECGTTYEAAELKNPKSKMNPDFHIEIKETEHLFYRLDLFQDALQEYYDENSSRWKSNVRAMTKQWLDMGLRPRAVTRDLDWGIEVPLPGEKWNGKCIYVWFEAVQGYLSCSQIWASRYAGKEDWKKWWSKSDEETIRHLYFLGKDNIPFHTVIWPAIIMGLNHVNSGKNSDHPVSLPSSGEFPLAHDVPAMEYLMLSGGQFSKSRKHAVWLPSFLENYDPDFLRYYLGINMPENHDTDFNWPDFVEKVNSELIAAYGNFVHRIRTLGHKIGGENPYSLLEKPELMEKHQRHLEKLHEQITDSLSKSRYKEALRGVMNGAKYGNQIIQEAAPWKHMKSEENSPVRDESLATLAFGWRVCRWLAILANPFLPFSSQKLWNDLGHSGEIDAISWDEASNWDADLVWNTQTPVPLFKRLDLEEILERENSVKSNDTEGDNVHSVKGGKKKKKGSGKVSEIEGVSYIDFEQFMAVDIKLGKIISVEDHPNADRLYVVNLDDGTDDGRTICAGLKGFYSKQDMEGMHVAFVANLAPRKLRGVMSEGMMLAADDGQGNVKLLTISGEMSSGSQIR